MDNNVASSLSEKCQALKLTIDAKLDEIEQCLAEVNEVKLIEYRRRICDHFYLLRNEVNIKRETVLENSLGNRTEEETNEINRLSANLIDKLNSTEEEFHKNLGNEIERYDKFRGTQKAIKRNTKKYSFERK